MKKTRSRFYLLLLFDWIMFSFLIENEGRRGVIVMETEGGLERDGEGGIGIGVVGERPRRGKYDVGTPAFPHSLNRM